MQLWMSHLPLNIREICSRTISAQHRIFYDNDVHSMITILCPLWSQSDDDAIVLLCQQSITSITAFTAPELVVMQIQMPSLYYSVSIKYIYHSLHTQQSLYTQCIRSTVASIIDNGNFLLIYCLQFCQVCWFAICQFAWHDREVRK